MKKIIFVTLIMIPLSIYSVKAQNKSDEPVLTIAQKKDSSRVINPNQEIDTKIPRLANYSKAGAINNSGDNIPRAEMMEKKEITGKTVRKK
jgi:hypothetical protein